MDISIVEPQNDLDLVVQNQEHVVQQIAAKVSTWQTTMAPFFTEFEEYAGAYRLLEVSEGTKSNVSTKTRVGETIRSTEALTTSIFRMMTSADPPYDILSMNGSQTPEQLFATSVQLRYQDQVLKWKRKLLRATRGLCLFGTQIVETPWVMKYRNGNLLWEGLDFVPRSLLQCAFDPNVIYIEESPWMAFLDYYTKEQLLDMAEDKPDYWNPIQVQKAVDQTEGAGNHSQYMQQRRTRAGYRETPPFEVITYYGRIRDLKRPDGRLWAIRVVNETVVVSAFGNPNPTGDIPAKVARYMDFELEPYGYGVGRLGRLAQRHLDKNRKRYMDISEMGVANMWIKDRLAGIKNSDLKIRPLGIIEADNVQGLQPFSPNLTGVDLGFKMEEIFRNEFQGNTGATQGLQAQVTDASATEASIAQNEAIRRISVIAEDIAESYVRDYQLEKHEYNMAFLESDLYLAVTGMEKPIQVNRNTMAPFVNIIARVTTDKNFRPKRTENLIQALQLLTSIRQRPNIFVDEMPVVKELITALDVNPKEVFRDAQNLAPNSVLNMLVQAKQNAGNAAQELGEPLAAAQEGGAPQDIANTPVGPVMMSQNG